MPVGVRAKPMPMHFKIPQAQSLKTRVTLFTLAIFVISIWSLAFYASRMLREDMQRLLGEQQYASVSLVADEVNRELDERLQTLKLVAQEFPLATPGPASGMQALLEQQRTLLAHFNGGLTLRNREGVAIADAPRSAGRIGNSYMDIEVAAAALNHGQAGIGRPIMGKSSQAPLLAMVAPIRDPRGQVVGALSGVIDLSRPNFLDVITQSRYGRNGGYSLVSRAHRLIVTSADKNRVMNALPAPGAVPMIDRALQGFEGTAVYVSSPGVERLASVKGVPVADWFVVSSLPTDEAFAPIRDMQQRVLGAAFGLTLLAGALTWWMLRRELRPLHALAQVFADMADEKRALQPLPITRQDEIGQLLKGFNSLVSTLGQQAQALQESEARYRTAFLTSPDAININRVEDGLYLEVNEGFLRLLGWRRDEVVGRTSLELNIWHNIDDRARLVDALMREGFVENLEADFVARDGRVVTALMSAHLITLQGEVCVLSVTRDITERKAAENQIRKLSLAVEQSAESIVITNLRAEIEYVNQAFVANTGYSREEALGQNPRLLHSGKTPKETYAAMWDAMARGERWEGEFYNQRKDGSEYVELASISPIRQADGSITHYVAVKEDVTSKKAAQDQINSLAFYDPLTELPNRRLLIDRLKQALAASSRHGREGALLFIDLDNFKDLNDTLGHDKGDLLLQQVARRLSACIREGDTVARLGGDEFVVILDDLSVSPLEAASQAELVGEKILQALSLPSALAGQVHHSSASIGVTLFSDHEETIDELLRRADLAMYQAKSSGRNTLRFYDPAMQAAVSARAALERDLHEALALNHFSLHYQPQLADQRHLTGSEALLRWSHQGRGMVSPTDFIPLAEATGLILPLGKWVLETACNQLALWALRVDMQHLTVSVNVSARQFHRPEFVDVVLEVLHRTGANPNRLKLELTESMLVTNVEDVILKMTALKNRGVGFSLDDFGTGYSSLSYLKRLPLDQLKVDQSFVRDILIDANDAAIARMVIALGHALGLSVIAEGVETEEQRRMLADQGCHAYQGFLFSRAVPVDEFELLVLHMV